MWVKSFRLMALLMTLAWTGVAAAQKSRVTAEGVRYELVRPSATDSEIHDFDDPHWVYFPLAPVADGKGEAKERPELLLWIPGTRPPNVKQPEPGHVLRGASHAFCAYAATLGYHVLSLSYPNSLSASSCNNDSEPKAFETFRMSIIAGGTSPHITVSKTDCIENRLIKALQYLGKKYPDGGWSKYLTEQGEIRWESIAVAGQSQGGGHAALMGVHHHVARVLCFGAPKDYSTALNAPAAWYGEMAATPKDRFFAFNHEQDRQGCTPEHQMDNLKALGLDALHAPVMVDQATPPFENSHVLMTNYPGGHIESLKAHGTMIDPKNEALFKPVWTYMLTQ